jgi:phosphoglycerate kinase
MKTITQRVNEHALPNIGDDLQGKKVLVRIDVNTTLGNNKIIDQGEDWRILKSLETINYLVAKGARVILISHIGRDPNESLRPVFDFMLSKITLGFIPQYDNELIKNSINNMQKGGVIMLENLRQHSQEELNDSAYLDVLVESCDIYVNDAFSVSHREHASVCDLAGRLPGYFGLQFVKEVTELEKALGLRGNTVLVLGGAKFGTKLDLLKQFLPSVQYALIGGALANVFLREQGFSIGSSFADNSVDISEMITSDKIILPIDVINQHGDVLSIDAIDSQDIILDIGPETEKLFETIIEHADTVFWNGPMGKYEDSYVAGSLAVADSIAKSDAYSITGGGDTAAIILEEDLGEKFDFISTGGGAMLEFLVKGTLPGIQAILEKE